MIQYTKYKKILLALANCGFITKHIAAKYFSIDRKQLSKLHFENFIINNGNYMIFGIPTTIYTLSSKGIDALKKDGKNIYKGSLNQLEHDYALLKIYSTLPLELQESWVNETELSMQYPSTITTDGVFVIKNKKIAVEVITSNYSPTTKKEKELFALNHCDDLIKITTTEINKILLNQKKI